MPGSEEERKELGKLINEGRLFEVEAWVEQGRPIRFVRGRYKKPISALDMAVSTGFHSMAEVLLRDARWDDGEIEKAIDQAVWNRANYLVELLLDYGAPTENLEFSSVCDLMDPELMERMVDRGLDPTRHDGYAEALSYIAARPLLRFYKQNHSRIQGLDEQLTIALVKSIEKKKLRATIMLLWAGADPARSVPTDIRTDFPGYADPSHRDYEEDEDFWTNAFEELAIRGDLDFFQKLKLKVPDDQLSGMVEKASLFPEGGLLMHLLDRLPDEHLNTSDRRSCVFLERLVARHFYPEFQSSSRPSAIIEAIKRCLGRGGVWDPPEGEIRYIRSALRSAPHSHTIEIIDLLHEHKQAPGKLWDVVRTPTMVKIFYPFHKKLWNSVRDRAGQGDQNLNRKVRRRRQERLI